MTVHFLNVGQGDSIVLQWDGPNGKCVGVVDCCVHQGKNKVLDFLKNNSVREIEFLVISHPHFDHFSGTRQVLEHCESNKIVIKHCLHTSQQNPTYMRSACASTMAKQELARLFATILRLYTSNPRIIKGQGYVSDYTHSFHLNAHWSMQFLAPSSAEFIKYLSKTFAKGLDVGEHSNPHGNWLSTLIKIQGPDRYALLTSDLESEVLSRLGTDYDQGRNSHFNGDLVLAQVPHHGSDSNHSSQFWKNRLPKHVVISVGQPNKYNHPGALVLKRFAKLNAKIECTNDKASVSPKALATAKKLAHMGVGVAALSAVSSRDVVVSL